jgi:hypothetical protein
MSCTSRPARPPAKRCGRPRPSSTRTTSSSPDLDADRDALADLIRRLRSVDPVQTLDSLLQELRLGRYPLLHGKAFQVTVGWVLRPAIRWP